MIDGVDAVLAHRLVRQSLDRTVQVLERSVSVGQRRHADVRGDDVLGAIALAERWDQLGADLT